MKNRLITTITLYLMVSLFTTSFAATITVDATDGAVADDGLCSISEAIIAANTDAVVSVATGECSAGNGTDTINITVNITLTVLFDDYTPLGRTGTPAISSAIQLDGMGFSLAREASLGCTLNEDVNPDEFRLIRIKSTGNLDLRNITLSHGCSDGMNSNGVINTYYSKTGAAIFNEGTLSMDNSVISENSADIGGGILNRGLIRTIQNSTFSGNLADASGGGIFNNNNITTIQNSTFSGNSANNNGGGIYNRFRITTIQNSTFSGNSANLSGGGIYNKYRITTIQNSTFSGNSAINYGGGIYNDIFDSASINMLRNSLFHQNTGVILHCAFIIGSDGIDINNLSDDVTFDCPGVSTTLTTATVGSLTDNGAPTMTHALLVGNQAIDAGNVDSTATDQRGISAFGTRDIGAYEYRPVDSCPFELQTDGFTTTVSNSDELNQAIECANLNGEANGGDTIELGADITLSTAYENDATYGRTGTPTISSTIRLDGSGFILERDTVIGLCERNDDDNADEFRIMRISNGGTLDLYNITLSNGCIDNESGVFRKSGGALFNEGNLSVYDSFFTGNSARSNGGGIYNRDTITTIQNSTFLNNIGVNGGGGIFNHGGSIITIQNSTFSDNISSGSGGGIYNNFGNISTIQNSTFSGNFAAAGSGIYNDTSTIITLRNSLFNNPGTSECVMQGGSFDGDNNISSHLASGCPGLLSTVLTSSSIGPLADNGGPTLTHALLFGSQALDAGNGSSTQEDQRGFAASGIRDIGAFEAHVPSIVAPIDFTVEATDALSSPSLGMPSVIDTDETGLIATASPAIDFSLGMTTVTWMATDSQGFFDTDTQVVNIVDTTAPIVNAPADITMEATDTLTPVNLGTATAIDLVDGALTPTNDASAGFPVGTTTVIWSATDAQNNTGIATQVVTIFDSAAPELTLEGVTSVILTVGDSYTDAGATATDFVDDDTTLTANIVVNNPVNTAIAGSYIITYDVSDNAGNPAIQITRTVNVLATVNGTVVGLAAGTTVEIQNNKGDNITINADGAFSFATALALDADYNVTVLNQPTEPAQVCSVSNPSGEITSGNINNVLISCTTNQYLIGGMVSGLASGNTVSLYINSSDETMLVNADGAFLFVNPLIDLTKYTITVDTQPSSPSQTCSVVNGVGQINANDVDDIDVNCVDDTFFVGGNISALQAGFSLLLKNNNQDEMTISTSGAFVFATPLLDLNVYDVSMQILPENTARDCVISNKSGSIAGDDIDDVEINCDAQRNLIFKNDFE